MAKVLVTTYMEPDLYRRVQELATQENRSLAATVERVIAKQFDGYEFEAVRNLREKKEAEKKAQEEAATRRQVDAAAKLKDQQKIAGAAATRAATYSQGSCRSNR
jgi:hypothetical protein